VAPNGAGELRERGGDRAWGEREGEILGEGGR
jgi:hypothetical protein